MKVALESCSCLTIGTLQKAIHRMIDRDYPDTNAQELFDLTKTELEKFCVANQHFQYQCIKNQLGGHRWFFQCPRCEGRISKLFLPPETSSMEHIYLCRECHGLKNQSVLMSKNKIYKKVTIPLRRLKEIEDKVERGHLTSEKVKELLDEYDAIEKELKSSPEYRLYAFKKKRGMT